MTLPLWRLVARLNEVKWPGPLLTTEACPCSYCWCGKCGIQRSPVSIFQSFFSADEETSLMKILGGGSSGSRPSDDSSAQLNLRERENQIRRNINREQEVPTAGESLGNGSAGLEGSGSGGLFQGNKRRSADLETSKLGSKQPLSSTTSSVLKQASTSKAAFTKTSNNSETLVRSKECEQAFDSDSGDDSLDSESEGSMLLDDDTTEESSEDEEISVTFGACSREKLSHRPSTEVDGGSKDKLKTWKRSSDSVVDRGTQLENLATESRDVSFKTSDAEDSRKNGLGKVEKSTSFIQRKRQSDKEATDEDSDESYEEAPSQVRVSDIEEEEEETSDKVEEVKCDMDFNSFPEASDEEATDENSDESYEEAPSQVRVSDIEEEQEETSDEDETVGMRSPQLPQGPANRLSKIGNGHRRTGSPKFWCIECGQPSATKAELHLHLREHDPVRPFKCGLCTSRFESRSKYLIHLKSHKDQAGRYQCTQCKYSTGNLAYSINHLLRHSGKKLYNCGKCGKAFGQAKSLTAHELLHSGERPYTCNYCTASFGQSGNLTVHKRVHSGERPYKCDQCSKSFTHSGDLTKHKRIHSGERPYKCDYCSKSFTQSVNLTVHKRAHSGERPYKCDQCSKSFTHSGDLTKHKRVHSGERPYKCDYCSKSFTQSITLTDHKRVHSGERPFMCDQCGKHFSLKSNLQKHKKTVHCKK